MGEQFKTNELAAIFQMLINDQKVCPDFPLQYLNNELRDGMGIPIDPVMVNVVNKLIGKSGEGGDTVTLHEAQGLSNEISTTGEELINFSDFVGIFKAV